MIHNKKVNKTRHIQYKKDLVSGVKSSEKFWPVPRRYTGYFSEGKRRKI